MTDAERVIGLYQQALLDNMQTELRLLNAMRKTGRAERSNNRNQIEGTDSIETKRYPTDKCSMANCRKVLNAGDDVHAYRQTIKATDTVLMFVACEDCHESRMPVMPTLEYLGETTRGKQEKIVWLKAESAKRSLTMKELTWIYQASDGSANVLCGRAGEWITRMRQQYQENKNECQK